MLSSPSLASPLPSLQSLLCPSPSHLLLTLLVPLQYVAPPSHAYHFNLLTPHLPSQSAVSLPYTLELSSSAHKSSIRRPFCPFYLPATSLPPSPDPFICNSLSSIQSVAVSYFRSPPADLTCASTLPVLPILSSRPLLRQPRAFPFPQLRLQPVHRCRCLGKED